MTIDPQEIIDMRLPNPADLAVFVRTLRDERKWSQETLAALARITERTVQRVENGEPSSLDTHRAIADAFGYELNYFDKPWPFPNSERLKDYVAEIEKTTIAVPIVPIQDGRTLRNMVEQSQSSVAEEIGKISDAAREAFAQLIDLLRDYRDMSDCYSMSERLDIDRSIEELLKKIAREKSSIGAGLRHAKLSSKSDAPNTAPCDWTNIYVVIASAEVLPATIRVPKESKLAW
jgi:transcriptional regulator with XRE-family HTH domain